MAKGPNKKKKRRIGWWIVLAIVVVGGLYIGWRILSARQEANQVLANIETEPYQRSTLSANIYGTGSVQPLQTAVLSWSASGIVGEVNVVLGQAVAKDDLMMSLDPDSVSVDILQAQIDVINTQNDLQNLYDNWESDLAQAKLDLIAAEDALERLENNRKIMNYQRCSEERIEQLEQELELAKQVYEFWEFPQALQAVNTAQANINYCRADYTEQEMLEAELELELSEASLERQQKRVDTLSEGPDPDQVTILETRLAMAQSRLDSLFVEAPFDGVVTVLSAKPGDVIQVGSQALQIDDLSQLYLDVQISEVDIPFVEMGQAAALVFDAYFESTFTGEVIEIAPVGRPVQGVVEYMVRIKMLDADERIKPGMTAAVNIVVDEKEDVFVIPNESIVSIDGQETVFVKRNGNYEAVEVELGSYSDFYSEVIEADIEEGELIALNPPDEITGEMPFSGPPGGGFGGFGN